MSNIKEKALEYHAAGFNCAQSVLAACNDQYDYIRCLDLKQSDVNCSEIIGRMAEIAENMIIKAKEN